MTEDRNRYVRYGLHILALKRKLINTVQKEF